MFSMFADLQSHGALHLRARLCRLALARLHQGGIALIVNGVVQVERWPNTSGDLLRLLPYLANEGAAITGGLRAGQWITTGSWTGNTPAPPNSAVEARFGHAGSASLRFA